MRVRAEHRRRRSIATGRGPSAVAAGYAIPAETYQLGRRDCRASDSADALIVRRSGAPRPRPIPPVQHRLRPDLRVHQDCGGASRRDATARILRVRADAAGIHADCVERDASFDEGDEQWPSNDKERESLRCPLDRVGPQHRSAGPSSRTRCRPRRSLAHRPSPIRTGRPGRHDDRRTHLHRVLTTPRARSQPAESTTQQVFRPHLRSTVWGAGPESAAQYRGDRKPPRSEAWAPALPGTPSQQKGTNETISTSRAASRRHRAPHVGRRPRSLREPRSGRHHPLRGTHRL